MRFSVERRLRQPRWLMVAVPAGSLVCALVVAGLVLLATGHNPLTSYRQLFDAAFISAGSLDQTLIAATPLAFTGLAAAAAFRMRLFNVGAEGQMYMGAITGGAAGLYFGGRGGPSVFVIAAMVVAGCAGGALWASIPAILRAFFKTNEILSSLMLNYVAGYVLTYLIFQSESYWRQTKGFNATTFPTGKPLPSSAVWPTATLHIAGRDRAAARRWAGRARGGRRLGALLAHAVRLRGAGARRLGARGALCGHPDPAEDPGGHGDLGRDRRARRSRARTVTSAMRSTATRTACRSRATATRGSSSRRSRATTRSPSCWSRS